MTVLSSLPPSAPGHATLEAGAQRMLPSDIQALFHTQRQASRQHIDVPLLVRRERLLRLQKMLDEHGDALAAAVTADFGMRPAALTELAELMGLRQQVKHTLRQLPRWMKARKVSTPLILQPAHAWVQYQPLGVVGIIAPWNYPIGLALSPVITALAAGNRVLLKPSEIAPHTAALLASLVARFFSPDEWAVIVGDGATAALVATLPFDHLVFTGSGAVGRKVAQAAAAHLTPTTLELGGKSPCLIDADADIADAALKIAHGKLLNAGQTCIAPDYVLLPSGHEAAFVQAYQAAVLRLYPTIAGNADYTSIITPRHVARLRNLLQQAQLLGAHIHTIEPPAIAPVEQTASVTPLASADAAELPHKTPHTAPPAPPQRRPAHANPINMQGRMGDGISRQMLPTVVLNVTSDMQLMQEEIFGPILPVVTYERLEDAITHINHGPRPLAMYWFGNNTPARSDILHRTISGGITLNDTLLHAAHPGLPFGGVGESGWGTCTGESGFYRLSHARAVLDQSRHSFSHWIYPPYDERFTRVMGWLRKWRAG